MSLSDRLSNTLRQLGRAVRARGLGHTIRLALRIALTEGPAGMRARLHALGPSLRPAPPQGSRTALVLTTPHTLHFARRLVQVLRDCGFQAELSDTDRDAQGFGLIVVFAPQAFPDLPMDRTIAFQVEPFARTDRWTPAYLARLARFRAVWDYSTANIERLRAHLPLRRLYHVPFSPLPAQGDGARHGVLFYGDATPARRQAMLARLRQRIPELTVQTNAFGPRIDAELARAAIVVNLHAVPGAVLETARISEALAAGAVVISETAPDQDDHPDIAARIALVPEGNVDALADRIRALLDDPGAMAQARAAIAAPLPDRFRLFVLRALQGLDLIAPAQFDALAGDYPPVPTGPGLPRLCLTLPETPARRRDFLTRNSGFALWPGMKADPGWRGCALSYRHMMRALRDAETPEALIVEDDVVLPADFDHRLDLARGVMDARDADMFSGLIVDLHPDTHVHAIDQVEGVTFVTLDRAVMMICNLYRPRMIDWLADWDDTDTNAFTNAIDRRMQRATHLRVVTTLPFTAAYQRQATSTLRESDNDQFDALLRVSHERLTAKVAAFRAQAGARDLCQPGGCGNHRP